MTSLATDIIKFNNLPLAAKKCHKFKEIWLPLLSVPQLCKSKLTVTFKGETVEISNSEGEVLITGYLDPAKDLFMVPIYDDDDAKPQRVTSGFAGAAGQLVETEYNGIVRPILTPEQHTAAMAHSISCVPALISYLHACAGFPVIVTWIEAINKGWYSTWPGLTSSRVRQHLPPSEHTTMGHMRMISKGIRSTQPKPTVQEPDEPEPAPIPMTVPTDNMYDVYVGCFENPLYDDRNTVGVDLSGRYPNTSFDGHKYIYVMVDSITNYINAKGLRSRKIGELQRGFEECYNDLKRKGFIARLVKLDNEISKEMVKLIESNNLDYQLAAPGDYRLMPAE